MAMTSRWRNQGKSAVLLLSAGHHGRDPGAVISETGGLIEEHQLTVRMCWSVIGWLQELEVPVEAVPVGTLRDKIRWVNERAARLEAQGLTAWAVEVHMNSANDSSAKGIETIHWPGNRTMREAGSIICNIVGTPTWGNRGPKTPRDVGRGKLAWVQDTVPSAMLVEYGFLTNREQYGQLLDRFGAKMTSLAVALEYASMVVEEKLANHPRV